MVREPAATLSSAAAGLACGANLRPDGLHRHAAAYARGRTKSERNGTALPMRSGGKDCHQDGSKRPLGSALARFLRVRGCPTASTQTARDGQSDQKSLNRVGASSV